ncbi:hypothetical protein CEXT_423321 [Caerostris extrusa]|uniref:Uncharacterized protein n=1 Tax=Caerostris extrusa TaxID=172846 RepID=A0AAV4VYS0_CAEEX|nr:hypothetical protein CEXT_423321 [Caerostris extrusa]
MGLSPPGKSPPRFGMEDCFNKLLVETKDKPVFSVEDALSSFDGIFLRNYILRRRKTILRFPALVASV